MDHLYPSLSERFKTEGLCPICMMQMELGPKYICTNEHTICYRCKPYYYNCPTCQSPLDLDVSSAYEAPSPPTPTHFAHHSLPPRFHQHHPSAPPINEFLNHERNRMPQHSPGNQELKACAYADFGCWVKLPIYLTDLHESRCQFRPHLEEDSLPTDVAHKHADLVECVFKSVGCNVMTSPWRLAIHQEHCIYKDNEGVSDHAMPTNRDYGDPNELVECKYRKYGCMVNMPRRRKPLHQEKCNYRKYEQSDDDSSTESELDPEEQVPCKWAGHGCRVRPKRARLETHETNCNYRMEECAYKDRGCEELFEPPRKHAHERTCQFADF